MRDYTHAIYIAHQNGVSFSRDFHAQDIGGYMAELAKDYGYRKPKNANGSTGRYFFQLLQRRARAEAEKPIRKHSFVKDCGLPQFCGRCGLTRLAHN